MNDFCTGYFLPLFNHIKINYMHLSFSLYNSPTVTNTYHKSASTCVSIQYKNHSTQCLTDGSHSPPNRYSNWYEESLWPSINNTIRKGGEFRCGILMEFRRQLGIGEKWERIWAKGSKTGRINVTEYGWLICGGGLGVR